MISILPLLFAATAGASLGPEISITAPNAAMLSPAPATASSGDTWLVVWHAPTASDANGATKVDLFAARVRGSDGAVLDASPIALTSGGAAGAAAVAALGTQFLVVYASPDAAGAPALWARRVDAATGAPSGEATLVSANTSHDYRPAVASDGAGWTVVWRDERGGNGADVFGARVSAAGAVLDPDGFAIAAGAGDQTDPVVASDGRGYVVAWTDYAGPFVATSRVEGATVSAPVTAASLATAPAIASNGDGYLVAWRDRRTTPADLGATLLDADGAPKGSALVLHQGIGDEVMPRVGALAGDYVAFWFDGATTTFAERGVTISAAGAIGPMFTVREPVEDGLVAVASGNAGALVSYAGDGLRARLVTTPSGTTESPRGSGLVPRPLQLRSRGLRGPR